MVRFSFRKKLLKGVDALFKSVRLTNAHGFIGCFTVLIGFIAGHFHVYYLINA